MEGLLYLIGILVGMVLMPILVYMSVKLGTYAFYRGRQVFIEQESKRHGEEDEAERERTGAGIIKEKNIRASDWRGF